MKSIVLKIFFIFVLPTAVGASNLSQFFGGNASSSRQIYLMKSDGVTKIGLIISNADAFAYYPYDPSTNVVSSNITKPPGSSSSYFNIFGRNTQVLFTTTDCTGTPYLDATVTCVGYIHCVNPVFNNGNFFGADNSSSSVTRLIRSTINVSGTCSGIANVSTGVFPIKYGTTICGDAPCIIKLVP